MAKRVLDKSKVDDLVLLDVVTEDAIVATLQARFNNDLIYTGLGPVLISVNPFKAINGLCALQMRASRRGLTRAAHQTIAGTALPWSRRITAHVRFSFFCVQY